MRVTVLGAGGWGTALSILLARPEHDVKLWCRGRQLAEELSRDRENRSYLPGYQLPAEIAVTGVLQEAVREADMVVVAVPIQHLRAALAPAAKWLPAQAIRLGVAKGFERDSLLRPSEVLSQMWSPGPYAILTGPSFAAEVAAGQPTAVAVASEDLAVARRVAAAMVTDRFRVELSDDVVGVEVAAALKNVLAIAAGMVRGLGYGSNALAALLTRGLREMTRLGVALGGQAETFLGLAGMGDLVLTGTGTLSRNGRVGEALALGRRPQELFSNPGMVAEGVETARATVAMAGKCGVPMPIAELVVQVLFEGGDARTGMNDLLKGDVHNDVG